MQDHLQLAADRRTTEKRRLASHYGDQARLAELEVALDKCSEGWMLDALTKGTRITKLERVLGDCVHALADTFDGEPDNPEPPCSIEAKRLLNWPLG